MAEGRRSFPGSTDLRLIRSVITTSELVNASIAIWRASSGVDTKLSS